MGIVWKLTREETQYGVPQRRLHGHSHFVSDVVLSSDGHFALSGSWDKNLRLWDLNTGKTTRRFEDHTKDVLSVAFSADNRQIVSVSRDKTIKLWNTLAQCKYTIQDEGHSDWVSCVRFSPNNANPIIVSCGWDRYVKVRPSSQDTLIMPSESGRFPWLDPANFCLDTTAPDKKTKQLITKLVMYNCARCT